MAKNKKVYDERDLNCDGQIDDKEHEHWANASWRPMMAWLYFVICAADFIIFPIAWAIIHAVLGEPVTQWSPITLQGAGLFHLSMGAILGIAAWGRTQEKLRQYMYDSPSYVPPEESSDSFEHRPRAPKANLE